RGTSQRPRYLHHARGLGVVVEQRRQSSPRHLHALAGRRRQAFHAVQQRREHSTRGPLELARANRCRYGRGVCGHSAQLEPVAATDSDGRPIDAAYARQRIRWEPVMEVAQVKGTSEVHPEFSPNDEFAGFEIYARLLTGGEATPFRADYARSALLTGLSIESSVGVNPYRFGMIGSTDSHTGLTSVDERNFLGKGVFDALPEERLNPPRANFQAWQLSASGLA